MDLLVVEETTLVLVLNEYDRPLLAQINHPAQVQGLGLERSVAGGDALDIDRPVIESQGGTILVQSIGRLLSPRPAVRLRCIAMGRLRVDWTEDPWYFSLGEADNSMHQCFTA